MLKTRTLIVVVAAWGLFFGLVRVFPYVLYSIVGWGAIGAAAFGLARAAGWRAVGGRQRIALMTIAILAGLSSLYLGWAIWRVNYFHLLDGDRPFPYPD